MAVNLLNLSTINRLVVYRGQPGTSSSTLFTVSTDTKIVSIIIANTTGTAATITLSVVNSGGTAGTTNQILNGVSVSANSTITLDSPIHMTANDFVAGSQGTGSALTVTISGETYA